MSHSYYYFAASLPLLSYEGELPFPVEKYLQDCQILLQEKDYQTVKNMLEADLYNYDFKDANFKAIQEFYRKFNNAKAVYRAGRLHKDPGDFIKGDSSYHPQLTEVVRQAGKHENLFEAEKMLDKTCWDFLDEITVGHYFDMEFLLAYGLKLKILERYKELNTKKGQEIYNQFKKMDFSEVEIIQV